jgi:phospholipase/carboxylesterase
MALSTYLPLADTLAAEASSANKDAPIFFAHGTHDPVIPFAMAVASRDKLVELGYKVEWHEYPMQHSVCPEEIRDIGAWLSRVLSN